MTLFANKQESNLLSCIHMVEDVLTSLGHDSAHSRLPVTAGGKTDSPTWSLRKGSATIFVSVLKSATDAEPNQLRVLAPVMNLDGGVDRQRLFQHLLELNDTTIKGAAFALSADQVILVAQRSTVDLDTSEVSELIAKIQAYADDHDDDLVAQFGGSLATSSR